MDLNFNKLAWEAPKHGDTFGYLPTDEHYDEIMTWLKTGTKRWKVRDEDVTTRRLSMPDSVYDVIAEYNHKTHMVSWTFRHCTVFEI